jgi:nitrogen-specific signal transduction histidine kinase
VQLSHLLDLIPKDSQPLSIRYCNELVRKWLAQEKLDNASQSLSSLLEQSSRCVDLHINVQADVLLTKAWVELDSQKYEAAENTLEKVGYVVSTNSFDSVYDAKSYLADKEYLRAFF